MLKQSNMKQALEINNKKLILFQYLQGKSGL